MLVDNHPYLHIHHHGRRPRPFRKLPRNCPLAEIPGHLRHHLSHAASLQLPWFSAPLAAGRRLVPLEHHNISDRSRLRERFLFS